MDPETLYVELGERRYPIDVGSGLLADAPRLRERLGAGAFALVTNTTVAPLYLDCLRAALGEQLRAVRVLPDGEAFKTLDTLSTIFDTLIDAGCDRQVTLVALGGGVVGDMTGFAAATWQRGVDFVQIPTTLLAQVDSSVGGKTAVNHPRGKNMIGAFHQPRRVIADTRTLDTLPAREFAAGLAEVIKYGVLGDAPFFHWLVANMARLRAREPLALREAVVRSCRNKAEIVCADERESGRRALLNFGHTFGHAIETATHYERYLHGEAVAIGMALAADLSHRLGWIDAAVPAALRALLQDAGLPVAPPRDIEPALLLELMGHDKKVQGGRIRLVLLRALGDALVTGEVPPAEILALLDAARGSPE